MPKRSSGRVGKSSPRSITSSTASTPRVARWPRAPLLAAASRPIRTTGGARPSLPQGPRVRLGWACAMFLAASDMKPGSLAIRGRSAPRLSLRTRVGLVLTGLAASLLLVLGALWLHGTRNAVHEEVEAATRVSEQWLKVVIGGLQGLQPAERGERLLSVAKAIGRVRANVLEIRDAAGDLRYVSPPSAYKAGRQAPEWFAGLLAANLATRSLTVDDFQLSLHPDPSRAVLDAWDELLALAGWALMLLLALFAAACVALARALRPLDQIMQALDRM